MVEKKTRKELEKIARQIFDRAEATESYAAWANADRMGLRKNKNSRKNVAPNDQ